MSAIDKSIYEEVIIESADGSRSVDISEGTVGISYYEDIFSPNLTARILVCNTGNSIAGPDGTMQSVYNGLPLRGGERVSLKIAGNSGDNPGLDFIKTPWFVSSITNVLVDNEKETFTLNLVPREALSNETSRVGKKYPASFSISDSVKDIVTNYLKSKKPIECDKTENPYGFLGNLRKPFTVLMWLASKSVPGTISGQDATAGYVFFETKEGYKFKSIDQLIAQKPYKEEYIFTPGDIDYKNPLNDYRILKFATDKNQDMMGKLKRGAFCSHRIFFNPLNFTYTNPEKGLFKLENYAGKAENLGKQVTLPGLGDDSDKTLGDVPSRNITAVLDIGTLEKNASTKGNADPAKIQSQTMMRYGLITTQTITMLIPSNTNLKAGDLIKCKFSSVNMEKSVKIDNEQSGLYMIKELCHYFDSSGSYTSLTLLRDTFGPKKK